MVAQAFVFGTLLTDTAWAFRRNPYDHLRQRPLASQDGGMKELKAKLTGGAPTENLREVTSSPPVLNSEGARDSFRRGVLRLSLLGLLAGSGAAIPAITHAAFPLSPPAQVEVQAPDSLKAVRLARTKQAYLNAYLNYQEAFSRQNRSLRAVQEDAAWSRVDEEFFRTLEAIRQFVKFEVTAMDKVIALHTFIPGSVGNVTFDEFARLIRQDVNAPGEFYMPPDLLNQVSFDITATTELDFQDGVQIEGILTVTTARGPDQRVYQYELPVTATLKDPGKIAFHFNTLQLRNEGKITRRLIDTKGTETERDDVVLGSGQVSRIEEGVIANVSFNALWNGIGLLPRGEPVSLEIPFVLAEGVLRPGSFQVLTNNMEDVGIAPSSSELNRFPFEYQIRYADSPTLAPLSKAHGLYELTFTLTTDRRRTFVVSGQMGSLLGRGETGTLRFRLSDRPIVETFLGQRVGEVSEVPTGFYIVSLSILDLDTKSPLQPNDRLAGPVVRPNLLFVGSRVQSGSNAVATDGEWFVDGSAIYTEGRGPGTKVWAEYEIDLGPNPLEDLGLVVYARNRTPGPTGTFDLEVFVDGEPLDLGRGSPHVIRVPIHPDGLVRTSGTPAFDLPSGVHRFRLQWVNDTGPTTTLQIERVLLTIPRQAGGALSAPVAGVSIPEAGVLAEEPTRAQVREERLKQELERAKKESERRRSILEPRLLLLPEAMRHLPMELIHLLRNDQDLREAEKTLLARADEVRQAAQGVEGAEAEVATMEWLETQRKKQTAPYATARITGLNLEGTEDAVAHLKLGDWIRLGPVGLSPFVEYRFRAPYLSGKSEKDQLRDEAAEVQKALDDIEARIKAERDPEVARRLNQERDSLKNQQLALEENIAELEHLKRVLHLEENLRYGLQGFYLLSDRHLAGSFRLAGYGSPVWLEEVLPGYGHLPGLKERGTKVSESQRLRFGLPRLYEVSNTLAWVHPSDLLELGGSGMLVTDPDFWTLWALSTQARLNLGSSFQLAVERGDVGFDVSFYDYLREATGGGTYREGILAALREKGLGNSFHTQGDYTLGLLSYLWDKGEGSAEFGTDFGGAYHLRLQGILLGVPFNAQTVLARHASPRVDVGISREITSRGKLFASLGINPNEIDPNQKVKFSLGLRIGTSRPRLPTKRDAFNASQVGASFERDLKRLEHLGENPEELIQGAIPSELRLRRSEGETEYTGPSVRDLFDRVKQKIDVSESIRQQLDQIQTTAKSLTPSKTDSSLYIHPVSRLNPETRELVGKIQDKIDPSALRRLVPPEERSDRLTAERLVKLHALLAHYFNGGEGMRDIHLPSGFQLNQLGAIDDVSLETIHATTYEGLILKVFPEMQQLELEQQKLQSMREKQV